MNYPGFDGFLGTRASFMLDFVVVAMALVLPVMGWSILQARNRRNYTRHKRLQLALGIVLAAAVTLFEIDIRIFGWRERASGPDARDLSTAITILFVHLAFAVSTVLLWIFVIVHALRTMPRVPQPGPYSRTHVFWARLAAIDMTLTAVSGWAFYWFAFVAK